MQVKLVSEAEVAQSEDAALVWCLTQGRVYTVLGIEADSFRLLHDDQRSDEDKKTRPYPERFAPAPTLFSPELFEIVDSSEPDFWVCEFGAEGGRYCYPKEWMNVGFFEDYFDRLPEAHTLFWDVYYKLYSDG